MNLDPNTIAAVKDKAEKYFSKGKFKTALATYEKIEGSGNSDPRIFIRMGDCARKLNLDTKAGEYYSNAIAPFVRSGFVIKAIGVCKMIIHIDPSREDVQERLASLVSGQGGEHTGRGKQGGVVGGLLPPVSKVQGSYESTGNEPIVEKRPVVKAKAAAKAEPALLNIGASPVAPPKETKRNLTFPKTPLFSDLRKEELFDVVRKVHFREYEKDHVLFSEGDSGDSIFIVVDGEVVVIGVKPDGSEVNIATLKEGSFFGEFGFFSGSKRETTVKCGSNVELLELKKSDMNEIIEKYPRVSKVLFDFYKERVVDRLMALSDIFAPMEYKDRMEVLKHVKSEKYSSGSDIMKEGEVGETMYLIKSGAVDVWVKGDDGEKSVVAGLKQGDFVGEIALATSKPRVATVTATTDVEVVVYSRPMIKHIIEKYPVIKDILTGVIKKRVVGSDAKKKKAKEELFI